MITVFTEINNKLENRKQEKKKVTFVDLKKTNTYAEIQNNWIKNLMM